MPPKEMHHDLSEEKRKEIREKHTAEKAKKEKKQEKKKRKAEEVAAGLRKKRPDKQHRRDWAAMKASLVYDERGVDRTPDGDWAYFPAAEPASEKALPAGSASELSRWMFLGFVEEGEGAREMLPSSDQESEGEGEGEEGDVEMGGMGGKGKGKEDKDGDGEGKGGGDALVGVEGGVAEMVLSGVAVQ